MRGGASHSHKSKKQKSQKVSHDLLAQLQRSPLSSSVHQAFCNCKGGQLASVRNPTEDNHLDLMTQSAGMKEAWLGGYWDMVQYIYETLRAHSVQWPKTALPYTLVLSLSGYEGVEVGWQDNLRLLQLQAPQDPQQGFSLIPPLHRYITFLATLDFSLPVQEQLTVCAICFSLI